MEMMGWSLRVRTTTGSRSSFLRIHSDSAVSHISHYVALKLRLMSLNALSLTFHVVALLSAGREMVIDDPRFRPVLERAERMGRPIHSSRDAVGRREANLYENLPGNAGALLANQGFGWHMETAIHVLHHSRACFINTVLV